MFQKPLTVLIVSHAFPPSGTPGAKRVARFCRYLPEFGIRPIVLTVDEPSCEIIDRSLSSSTDLEIERIQPQLTVVEKYHRRAEGRAAAQETGSSDRHRFKWGTLRLPRSLRRHLLALLSFPDLHAGWRRPAVIAAVRTVATSRVDAVFSSGPPWTSHAVAHAVVRRQHVPWVADFRDQWALDPWRRYESNAEGIPAWRKKLDLWTEDRWVRHAALVVCTTNRQRESLLHAHSRLCSNRVITISNGCEKRRNPGQNSSTTGPRVLLHVGELYGGRRIGAFCRALESLVRNGKLSAHQAVVKLIGRVDPEIERDAQNSAPELFRSGMIAFRPQVDWKRAQEYLDQADVLLIFQGDHPTAIPAKFYEYIQTGQPILAVAGDGELKDIVLRTGSGFVAGPEDEAGISSAIEQALQAQRRSAEEVDRLVRQFDVRNLTADLAENIRATVRQI